MAIKHKAKPNRDKDPIPPKKNGRPLFDGKSKEIIVAKLEEAFAFGCSDLEACYYADISKDTLYRMQKADPHFCERKEMLKERPTLIARQSVVRQMTKDGDLSLRFLERKKRDEFSTKTEVENTTTIEIQQTKEKLKGIFDKKKKKK